MRPFSHGWISLLIVPLVYAISAGSCHPAPRSDSGRFEDITRRAGLAFVHQFCHNRIANILLSNGAGGAVLDFDNDGFVDIFLVNWGPLAGVTSASDRSERAPDRLYRNRGDGTFEDVTTLAGLEGAGFSSSATAGDFDGDGYEDLFVVTVGRSALYRNRGDGTFEDVTDRSGVGHVGTGIAAAFLDIDRDGFLDLFLANYLTFDPATVSEQNPGAYPGPLAYPGEPNTLYRNRGDGTFADVSEQSGIKRAGHRAMSVTPFDHDWDGDTDIYVSNDDTPNALWFNDGTGHFHDVAVDLGVAFNSIGEAPGSMNASVGDVNGDGLVDLFITRLGYGSLYVQEAKGRFKDRMWASGLGRLTRDFTGWGGSLVDFDNDGDLDLVIANGDVFTRVGSRSLLLANKGDGSFLDASTEGGEFFARKIPGRGSCVLDHDNDGRLDLLVTTLGGPAVLLGNQGATQHWLTLDLVGSRSNRDGFGALVTMRANGREWRAEALCPTGFLIQGDRRLHFGLGPYSRIDSLSVRWPSGRTRVLENVAADRILKVSEPAH